MNLMELMIGQAENGRIPDGGIRFGIRRLLKRRLRQADRGNCQDNQNEAERMIRAFSNGPIALVPEKANEQHYEVPAGLFQQTLGPRRKYSCCWFPAGVHSLAEAEESALRETCLRAEVSDGMKILELGCGWGSLTLWLAENYPAAKITAVSNSSSQREFILREAERLGLSKNLSVITCDMNDFSIAQQFDRVLSIEMFEHMRNYQLLMSRIANWLRPDGKLFVHIFCHRELTYEFQEQGASDWMTRYFFAGGIMPADSLLGRFQNDLKLVARWRWNGLHYQRTCEAWLQNMDQNRQQILRICAETYGTQNAAIWFNRWRMFYLACSELFGYNQGNEWWVGHYLFAKTGAFSSVK